MMRGMAEETGPGRGIGLVSVESDAGVVPERGGSRGAARGRGESEGVGRGRDGRGGVGRGSGNPDQGKDTDRGICYPSQFHVWLSRVYWSSVALLQVQGKTQIKR